jgi:hypothetical protein
MTLAAPHEGQQVEQRVEVTKTAQQAVPVVAYDGAGFPYQTQAIRPVQVKTTTTHKTESAAPHVVGQVAAAAPLVQTVASAPVVQTAYAAPIASSAVVASPWSAGYVAASPYWSHLYNGWQYPYTAAYASPVYASTTHHVAAAPVVASHVAAPLVSAGYVPSVYGYSLNGHYVNAYDNYLLLKKKKK